MGLPYRSAGVVDIWPPISLVGDDTLASAVGDDTLAKCPIGESPSMKPTVTVDPVGIKTRVIYPFLSTSERGARIFLGKKL